MAGTADGDRPSQSVLITGASGFLGERLLARAPAWAGIWPTRRSVSGAGDHHAMRSADLSDAEIVDRLFADTAPDLVIHAAYDARDGDRNIVDATANVARACAGVGARLIHMSSDVVFDGESAPYAEGSALAPIHEYGRQKAAAERDVVAAVPEAAIVRTSLLTSADPLDPRSDWVATTAATETGVGLFTDEIRCPAHVDDVAAGVWEIARLDASTGCGFWHLVGPQALSRFELGRLIVDHVGGDPAGLVARRSADQSSPRPRDLTLTSARATANLRVTMRPVDSIFS